MNEVSVILLSIKPEYCMKILNGIKKYEFRKHLAKNDVNKIVIYSTFPEKLILGEVEVTGRISMEKAVLWEQTKDYAGISREKYEQYFKDCREAHAYILGETKIYDEPLSLEHFGLRQAPQSFVYLKNG